MGTIIGHIIIGLLGGAIAKAILPGGQGGGWLATMLLGIVGGYLGGTPPRRQLQRDHLHQGLIFSVVGAILVLLIYGLVRRKA